MWFKKLVAVLFTVCFINTAVAQEKDLSKLEDTLYIDLPDGRVVIELMPDVAPKHVARIKELAGEKFYDGVVFHRVIEGFMAQTGDPTGTGRGGSEKPDLEAEFSNVPHQRGVVSMARANDPNSANSQFFIVLEDSNFLDGKYTVFGKVVEGMDHVDSIKKGDSRNNGSVENPTAMVSVRVASEVESN
ncbi:MAG: peptidylprolyl isomerase [Alphaproteobacteria bacterium CG11_big_fil_rev_8_21_14_0_20_39_49]|nr:MAG: peptidylprolyl isomerase [Alphaproteobacteria bacterium CG11_big_fil_rev_8_21_14_0_20_39_49]